MVSRLAASGVGAAPRWDTCIGRIRCLSILCSDQALRGLLRCMMEYGMRVDNM